MYSTSSVAVVTGVLVVVGLSLFTVTCNVSVFDTLALSFTVNVTVYGVHVKVVGKKKSFKKRQKDGILFGEAKV